MRNLLFLVAFVFIFSSCKQESKDYAEFTISLKDKSETELTLTGNGVNKKIQLNEHGVFSDTLHLKKPAYLTFYTTNPKQRGFVFLDNGYDLQINSDATNFILNTSYKGAGDATNNLINSEIQYRSKLGNLKNLFDLEEGEFNSKIAQMNTKYDSIHNAFNDADSVVLNTAKANKEKLIDYLKNNYSSLKKIRKGLPSPQFTNYENYKGGTNSLSDYKGKYVYIDLWATWCKPCIIQIPFLKKLEEKYKKKNITFISISTDSEYKSGSWEKAHTSWKNMVKDKELSGVQLYAGKDQQFAYDYQVTGIPRFILIDPKGNIVESNAPRPSDPKLEELFTELGI